jgi:hypothetical protein
MISVNNKKILLQYLEGTLSGEDRKRLERELAENSEWKACLDEMIQLDEVLTDDARESPKIDLSDPIMNAIHQKMTVYEGDTGTIPRQVMVSPWKKTMNHLFPNPQWNVAWGFIAGVIAGIAVLSLFHLREPSGVVSEMDATGTFASKEAKETVLLPVDLPTVKLNLTSNTLPQNFTQLNMQVTSEKSSLIQLSFNTSSFQVWSLRPVENKQDCQILAGYDYIEIGNRGQNTYIILLKKLTTVEEELSVSIYQDGNLEFNSQIKI